MKKLLIFAKTIDGGTGTYLTNLLKMKNIFGDEVKISVAALERPIYMKQSDDDFNYMKKRDYSLERYSLTYKNLSDFLKEFFWIRKIIKNENPDVILSVDVNCNLNAGLNQLFTKTKFKTIFTTHSDLDGNLNQKSTRLLKFILKKVIRFFYNRADVNICVSKELSDSIDSVFKVEKDIITIYNGLGITNTPMNRQRSFNNTILTVARLDKQKDYFTLLKAFELLVQEIKNVRLLIVGDGPLKNELQHIAEEKNIESNVEFLGWQKKPDDIFLRSDIFVLSSRREGFPYALIEAMSFGLPVVCTDTPFGPKEILDDGKYGFLIPMKDHAKMKKALHTLLENQEIYTKYSQLAKERSGVFTSDRMISEYAMLIQKLF
jgi:glycosyltransferase involved in cell wall biosynthesis